ncbi:MAG: response regulator, partial [Planctomycetaceae bacterium]|nr:response regulator [Planctomycetaceae bacterium]
MKRILVVVSHPLFRESLQQILANDGYSVVATEHAACADSKVRDETFDLILLKSGRGDRDRLCLLSEWRRQCEQTPVIVLSENSAVEQRIQALELGADDCLVIPFDMAELKSRIRAVLRRTTKSFTSVLRYESLELHLIERQVRMNGQCIPLTPRQF